MENNINQTLIQALESLDATLLEPIISENLTYTYFLTSCWTGNKNQFPEWIKQEFHNISLIPKDSYHIELVDYKGNKRVAFIVNGMGMVYDIAIEDGKISELHVDPFPSFDFNNYQYQINTLCRIAYNNLSLQLSQPGFKPCAWLQTSTPEMRFQDLCIAYDAHVLSIIIGLYCDDGNSKRIVVDQNEYQNLLIESENNNLIPCIYCIDPDGKPHFDGINLIDGRTKAPIDLNNITDNSDGKMSKWEISNLGVAYACEHLHNIGCTNIEYCDIPSICPQIFFNYNGQDSYAVVRAIPNGCTNEKVRVNIEMLNKLSSLKGYFIDVRMNSLFGGTGLFDDKFLYRDMLFTQRYEGEPLVCNLAHNEIELIEIEKALTEMDCIEVSGPDVIN